MKLYKVRWGERTLEKWFTLIEAEAPAGIQKLIDDGDSALFDECDLEESTCEETFDWEFFEVTDKEEIEKFRIAKEKRNQIVNSVRRIKNGE